MCKFEAFPDRLRVWHFARDARACMGIRALPTLPTFSRYPPTKSESRSVNHKISGSLWFKICIVDFIYHSKLLTGNKPQCSWNPFNCVIEEEIDGSESGHLSRYVFTLDMYLH